jgi:hypothetical protein
MLLLLLRWAGSRNRLRTTKGGLSKGPLWKTEVKKKKAATIKNATVGFVTRTVDFVT